MGDGAGRGKRRGELRGCRSFFVQAEDGIRDYDVTGVQTCALPIFALCATCHGAQGEGDQASNGPKLAGQQAWYIERQLKYFKTGVRGGEGDSSGQVMAQMAQTLVNDDAIRNMAAYIATLPDNAAQTTVSGDVENGEDIYSRNCAACHLKDGSGTWYTDAPTLAGMSDWYFVKIGRAHV